MALRHGIKKGKFKMNEYVQFLLHDPIGNVEGQVTDFNEEILEEAANRGMVFIGVKADGSRELVPYTEVKEPEILEMAGIEIVRPSYVDARIDEVMSVLEDVVSTLSASTNVSSAKISSLNNSIGEIRTRSQAVVKKEEMTLGKLTVE